MAARLNFEQLSQMFKLPNIQTNAMEPNETSISTSISTQDPEQQGLSAHQNGGVNRTLGLGKGEPSSQSRSPRISHARGSNMPSPRARRVEKQQQQQQQQQPSPMHQIMPQQQPQRVLPPGYKTREQIDKEKAIAAAREAYLNNAQNSNNNDSAAKAQYEFEKGYMSKHHIESIEHQIKKMQV